MIKCQFVLKEHGKEMYQKNNSWGVGGSHNDEFGVSDYNKAIVGTTEVSIF